MNASLLSSPQKRVGGPRSTFESPDLLRTTLRTVAMLLGAWFVFVGSLSVITVLLVGKAVGNDSHPTAAAVSSDVAAPRTSANAAKKI